MKTSILLAIALLCAPCALAGAPWTLDLEAAMDNAESNDVAIPNDETGTRFSLTHDLKSDDDVAFRVELGVRLGRRNTLAAVYAPLRLHSAGAFSDDVAFNGETFPAGEDVQAVWQFNSYRLRWTWV